MEAALREWWERQRQMIEEARQEKYGEAQADYAARHPSYQTGGRIPSTGLYRLHQGEEVIRPDVAAAVRHMMGGNLNQNALVGAIAGGGGTQIGSISIPIYAQPGMDEKQVAKFAVRELIRQLGEI
jgi:hypothetical protein